MRLGTHSYWRQRALQGVVRALALWLAVAAATAAEHPAAVRDLRYGVMLYEYFRGNYLDALVEHAVAETAGGIVGHSDYPRLMRGSIRLNWNMDQGAYQDFAAVLRGNAAPAVSDQAWFYLGKLYQRRHETAKAAASLDRVGSALDEELIDELQYLRGSLDLDSGADQAARAAIDHLPGESPWRAYLLLKLASADARAGNNDAALESLGQLLTLPAVDEERLVLLDRARLDVGLLLIGSQQAESALPYLRTIRQQSPYAQRAMLALGWASSEAGDLQAALAPWQALDRDPVPSLSQAEARLGLSWAYERLGMPGLAQRQFDAAASQYQRQTRVVDAAIADMDLDWSTAERPLQAFLARWPELPELSTLAASGEFRQALQRNRDLHALERRLRRDRQRCDMLTDGLALREQRYQSRADAGALEALATQLAALRSERDALAARLASADAAADGLDLLDTQGLHQRQQLDRADQRLARLQADGAAPPGSVARLRRLRGLLIWSASDAFSTRRWQASKELEQIDALLVEADTAWQDLRLRIADPLPFASIGQRVAASTLRAEQLLEQLQTLRQHSDAELQDRLAVVLTARRALLQRYQQFARLSAARLAELAITEDVP